MKARSKAGTQHFLGFLDDQSQFDGPSLFLKTQTDLTQK